MAGEEKRTETLPPLRITEGLLDALKELAFVADRSVSDYVRWALEMHVYGHGRSLHGKDAGPEDRNASQCIALKGRGRG